MNITIYTTTASSDDVTPTEFDDVDYGDSGPCDYPPHGSKFLPALYSFIFLLGLLGNALVLWVILKRLRLRSMTDVSLLNLAVADLLLVCSLPFLAHQAWDQWLFGEAMCKIVLGAYYFGFYGSIFFVTLMSVDRYLAIVHSVHAMRARTRTNGGVAAAVTWLAAFLASFPEVLYIQVHSPGEKMVCVAVEPNHNQSERIFALFKLNVLGLLIPLAIMGFCYTMILRKLLIGSRPSSKKDTAIRLVVVVVVVFFCCWTPYNVTIFFMAVKMSEGTLDCEHSKAITLTLQVTETLAYFHACLNPIVYVFVGVKFRKHLLALLDLTPCKLGQAIRTRLPQDSTRSSVYSQSTNLEKRSTTVSSN